MIPSFYNTTHSKGQTLINFNNKAKSQEELILTIFQLYRRALAWSEVQELLIENVNEVSIKRAITNLYKSGKLQKTSEQIKGKYGKPCYKYKLV